MLHLPHVKRLLQLRGGEPGPLTGEVAALVETRRAAAEAAQIGEAWIQDKNIQPTFAQLVKGILGANPPVGLAEDPKAMKQHVARQHMADLRKGQLEIVRGWHFSSTEVHLYALVAFARKQHG